MKVAILGFGSSQHDAPWTDPSWEKWGMNGGHAIMPARRCARWFQIHPPYACNAAELEWLAKLNDGEYETPTYVRPEDLAYWTAAYPHAAARHLLVPFPIEEIYRVWGRGWLVNTFCLMIALALVERHHEIGLYGVECLSPGREVVIERPGVAHWMGMARGMGAVIHLPGGTSYPVWPHTYGFDYFEEARAAARISEWVFPKKMDDGENLDTMAEVDAKAQAVAREAQSHDDADLR